MKIGVFIDLFKPYELGGAEKNCYEICKRLSKNNSVIVYTTLLEGEEKEETIKKIKINRLGVPHSLEKREIIPLFFYLYIGFLKGLKGDYDVIWGNGFIGSFLGGLISIFKRKPLVITLHDVYWHKWNFLGFSFPGKFLEKILSKLPFKKLITVSWAIKEKMINILEIPEQKITVIPNGIDLRKIDSIKAKRKDNVLLSVGRLVDYKNHDHIIKAFSKVKEDFPNLELRIIGSGPNKSKLKKLVKKLEVENVRFLGFLPKYEDVLKEMKKSTSLVHASETEGFGIVLLEAMASKLPVVAYDLPVYHEFATQKNCILVEKKITELEKGIRKVLESKNLKNQLKKEGYMTAKEFTWGKVAEEVKEVLVSVKEE